MVCQTTRPAVYRSQEFDTGFFQTIEDLRKIRNMNPIFFFFFFLNVGPPKEDIFSGHLLSPIFQSAIYITNYITSFILVQLVHRPTWYSNSKFLNFLFSQKIINFSPLAGFESGTSQVASRHANDLAITA